MAATADTGTTLVRLLIVEDHELVAGMLALALRQRGLEVEITSGPTADAVVDTARRLAPVLVLLDLDLGAPLGSGLELIGPLIDAGGRVVMLTGATDNADLATCVEAGAIGIVSKAAPFADLVETVRRAAEGEALLSEARRHALLTELRERRRADDRRLRPFSALTTRERAVLAGLVAGETAEAIAAGSFVSLATVRSQIRSILTKLGVNTQLAAVALAREAGWPE